MQCTLFIPDLFWPGETADEAVRGLELAALKMLLARASAEQHPAISSEAWLCQAFEVERQQDWPVAPLTLALDGGDPGDAYWLRADPVHLEVGRERIVLIESTLFDIAPDEAQSLITALNAHFPAGGVTFHGLNTKRWYARLAHAPRLVTHTLSEAAGRDVEQHLPSGPDALQWHTLFNEIQMLLHMHPVNAAREAAGAPVVNSVWLWGGGTRAAVPGHHFASVSSDEPLAAALAAGAHVHAEGLSPDAESWRQGVATAAGDGASHLVVMSGLANAVRYRDAEAWRARLAALETRWFAPLARALRSGSLAQLTIVAPCATRCWRFEARRSDLFRFWRRAQPWSSYA